MLMCLLLIDSEEDKEKFARIYETYRSYMYIVAFQILKDECDAEDALHNAFIKLTDCLENVQEDNAIKTKHYLAAIVKNAAIDLYRKNSKRTNEDIDSINGLVPLYSEPSPEISTEIQEILLWLQTLPEEQKSIITLYCYEKLPVKKIAQTLGMSESSIYKILSKVKKEMGKYWELDYK